MNERDLKLFIEEVVRGVLQEENLLLNEMSLNRDVFIERLDKDLPPVVWNLICIVIFHDINQDILNHWKERATNYVKRFFTMRIKKENYNLRKKAVRESFTNCFGVKFEEIDEHYYQQEITAYSKKGGNEAMYAKYNADHYHKVYTSLIIEVLKVLEESIVDNDHSRWINEVDSFVKQFRK